MELASLVIQNAFWGLFYGCFQKTQKFDLNHSEILNFGFNSTRKFEPDPKPEEARSDHIFWAFGKTQSNSNPKVQTRHETRNPRNFDLLQSYQIKSEKRLFKLCIEIFCAKLKIDLKIFAKALEVAKRKTFLRWIEDPWDPFALRWKMSHPASVVVVLPVHMFQNLSSRAKASSGEMAFGDVTDCKEKRFGEAQKGK